MKPKKQFDCVEMKRRIQEDLDREYHGFTDDQRRARIREELERSADPVARKWRAIAEQKGAVRETRP